MLKKLLALTFFSFNAISIFAQGPANMSFTTTGSYSWSNTNTYTALVEVWAAGGGAGTGSNTGGARTGGGGGSYGAATRNLIPGAYNITVGSGGSTGSGGTISAFGGVITTDAGNAGNSGTTVGTGGLLSGTTVPTGGTKYAGGDGGTNAGNANSPTGYGGGGGGAGGSAGGTGQTGVNGTTTGIGGTGGVAGTGGGNGGHGGNANSNGLIGFFPGGGGGGKGDLGSASGAGANGLVKITVISTTAIKLNSFDVIKSNKNTIINWATATEDPHDKFEIFRSGDGKNWEKISTVLARGTGNNNYNFTDKNTLPGVNFYYLKVTETSGSFFYSNTEKLDFKAITSLITIFPNPSTNQLQIKIPNASGIKKYVLIGSNGTVHTIGYIDNGLLFKTIDVSQYPTGKYIMMIFQENNQDTEKIKFVIAR